MANAIISYVNYFDLLSASVSAASVDSTGQLVAANLKSPSMKARLRTANGVTTQSVVVDWGSTALATGVGVLGVFQPPDAGYFAQDYADGRGHYKGFMSASDTIRNRLSTSSPTSGDLHDSGTVAGNWAVGYGQNLMFPSSVSPRYWQVDISAPSLAAAGYLDLGRMWAGPAITMTRNFAYGWQDVYQDGSIVTETQRSGNEYVDLGPPKRVMVLAYDALTEAEAKATVKELQRVAGRSGQVLFIPDPANTTYLPTQAILGRLKEVIPITQPNYATYSTTFTITQTL